VARAFVLPTGSRIFEMARRCTLTRKGVLTGNNVSHANNKTRRRYLPNLQSRRLFSETLGESVRLRIAASTLRTIEKRGGLDGFLVAASSAELPGDLARLRQRIVEQQAKRAA
jgi:large subunit ribosomal protein L28